MYKLTLTLQHSIGKYLGGGGGGCGAVAGGGGMCSAWGDLGVAKQGS